jgi:orotidine-5'-phosphate decarboxylase
VAEIVLALDLPEPDAALRLLDRLPALEWVKLGPILMTRAGAPFVQQVTARGLRVFLDLKWHDIPNTVAGAVTAARELGVSMATLHVLGGYAMLEAAARAAGDALSLVGVTVLTSYDATSYAQTVGRPEVSLEAEVVRLAGVARAAGPRGRSVRFGGIGRRHG